MAITIQIHEKVKQELYLLKEERESYEEVISRLINTNETNRRQNKQLLIEGYKAMAKDSLEIINEWEKTDLDWD